MSEALTFSTGGTLYCVRTNGPGTALRSAKVILSHFMDGTMRARYKDRVLALTRVKRLPMPGPAEHDKTIDARVDALVRDPHPPGRPGCPGGTFILCSNRGRFYFALTPRRNRPDGRPNRCASLHRSRLRLFEPGNASRCNPEPG